MWRSVRIAVERPNKAPRVTGFVTHRAALMRIPDDCCLALLGVSRPLSLQLSAALTPFRVILNKRDSIVLAIGVALPPEVFILWIPLTFWDSQFTVEFIRHLFTFQFPGPFISMQFLPLPFTVAPWIWSSGLSAPEVPKLGLLFFGPNFCSAQLSPCPFYCCERHQSWTTWDLISHPPWPSFLLTALPSWPPAKLKSLPPLSAAQLPHSVALHHTHWQKFQLCLSCSVLLKKTTQLKCAPQVNIQQCYHT